MKPLRTLITPVVIAALAVAGLSSAPARAGNDDLAKLILGLGAVALTIGAIENNKKKRTNTTASRVSRDDRIVTIPDARRRGHRESFALPEACLRTYSSSRGDRRLFSGKCLSKLPYRVAELPGACSYTIMERKKVRGKAYGPRCLARHGFYRVDNEFDGRRGRDEGRDRSARHIVFQ